MEMTFPNPISPKWTSDTTFIVANKHGTYKVNLSGEDTKIIKQEKINKIKYIAQYDLILFTYNNIFKINH